MYPTLQNISPTPSRLHFHPRILAVEGNDGVGKTTLHNRLVELLGVEYGYELVTVKEPASEFARDAHRRLRKGALAHSFAEDEHAVPIHTMILQDITAYRARMHFANGIWLDEALTATRFVVQDRTWWSTIAYQYAALDVDVPTAIADHFECLSAPHRSNGVVPLPGVVFYVTDGAGGALARKRMMERGELDPVYENVMESVFLERERRYRELSGDPNATVFTLVNDFDTVEEWEAYVDKRLRQFLDSQPRPVSLKVVDGIVSE